MMPGEGPDRCEFTPKQEHTLSFIHYAALSIPILAAMSALDSIFTRQAKIIPLSLSILQEPSFRDLL
jgi:hypothetical protein